MPLLRPWVDCWEEEQQDRITIMQRDICTFGIKPLDDALIGLLRNDLCIIGADSGVGKSELALKIALHNAINGKKVALFFIEGGAKEAIARIKWSAMKDKYYSTSHFRATGIDLDYRLWRMNRTKDADHEVLSRIEQECKEEIWDKVADRLKIYDYNISFNISDLKDSLGEFLHENALVGKPYGDLIVIDHLQYFDLPSTAKNEFAEMGVILKEVKKITDHSNIPIILVSHLRKKDKDRGLPNQEDFHGTSNIAKISSISITITPWSDKDDYANDLYPTFFRIVKSRTGIRSSYAMLCNFDIRRQRYDDFYTVHKLIKDSPESDPMPFDKLPKFARGQVNHNPKREEVPAWTD